MKVGLLFGLLWLLLGNPFVAILVLLLLLYFLDRSFIGIFPSFMKPIRRSRRLSKVLQDIRERPFDVSAKQEAARLYMEKKRWGDARRLLEEIMPAMEHSAEVTCDLGICRVKTGDLEQGERDILRALEMNPRVRYGEPYLRLAEALAPMDSERAVAALQRFREANSSSCEFYYKLGRLYDALGKKPDAKAAYAEAVDVYRALPKYKRKTERRWALLSAARNAVG
ncbi:tetratricopeptide repeat protein [Paenibacillus sp.]|uniref:tetratricopeptide repeat protein n=1 Tax=Paenibacillus sp. TaxID=58172 RepID=UPI002812526C|nr:tetratricopeptide repeat protein [Paenibacillus sp.]